jgi:hypothetical protein
MTTITNAHGRQFDFDSAMALMDDEIVKAIEGTLPTEQDFFEAYCVRHEEKYGEEFEFNKKNPVV